MEIQSARKKQKIVKFDIGGHGWTIFERGRVGRQLPMMKVHPQDFLGSESIPWYKYRYE